MAQSEFLYAVPPGGAAGDMVAKSSPASGLCDWRTPWPVGAIFLAMVDTDPSVLLGFGTWIQVKPLGAHTYAWERKA